MKRSDALTLSEQLHRLSTGDALLLTELDNALSPAEQSALRSAMRECGKRWAVDFAFVIRDRKKGAAA